MKTKTPKLPRYTGPALKYGNLKEAIRMAGPAPAGWRYLSEGERIPKGRVKFIFEDTWKDGRHAIGELIHGRDYPWAVPVEMVRKPSTVYFCSPSTNKWVGKVSGGVEFEYSKGGRSDTTCPKVLKCVADGLAGGTYKNLTRAEFLATLKRFEIKEDGTKIVAAPDYKAENISLKASLASAEGHLTALRAEVASLKAFKEGVEALLGKKKN